MRLTQSVSNTDHIPKAGLALLGSRGLEDDHWFPVSLKGPILTGTPTERGSHLPRTAELWGRGLDTTKENLPNHPPSSSLGILLEFSPQSSSIVAWSSAGPGREALGTGGSTAPVRSDIIVLSFVTILVHLP